MGRRGGFKGGTGKLAPGHATRPVKPFCGPNDKIPAHVHKIPSQGKYGPCRACLAVLAGARFLNSIPGARQAARKAVFWFRW